MKHSKLLINSILAVIFCETFLIIERAELVKEDKESVQLLVFVAEVKQLKFPDRYLKTPPEFLQKEFRFVVILVKEKKQTHKNKLNT